MCAFKPSQLVDEAEMVSREMINVAITRQELWHEVRCKCRTSHVHAQRKET